MLPKPLQKPHPQVWVACQSDQSVDWTASQGYLPLFPARRAAASRSWAGANGSSPAGARRPRRSSTLASPRTAVQRFVYVCDSEEGARDALWQTRWQRRVADHLKNNRERIVAGRTTPTRRPPNPATKSGGTAWSTARRSAASPRSSATPTWIQRVYRLVRRWRFARETVERSMRRFAAEVMPAFTCNAPVDSPSPGAAGWGVRGNPPVTARGA